MFERLVNVFFEKRERNNVTLISKNNREIIEKTPIKKPLASSGVFSSFDDREFFYKSLFNACNRQ